MRGVALYLVVLLGTGCAVAESHDDEAQTQSAALVHVERQDTSAHVVARYVRAVRVDADALRATGGSFDLPPSGQCAPLDGHAVGALAPVELIAAGPTSVTQAGANVDLVARNVPDVSDLVSGVVYTKTTALAPGLAAVTLAGVAEPIAIEVPPALVDVSLELGRPDLGRLEPGSARLGWAAWSPAHSAATESVVTVDVHGGPSAVRCTLEDVGAGEIDRAWFGPSGTVVVRRVVRLELEREPFQRIVLDSETSHTLAY